MFVFLFKIDRIYGEIKFHAIIKAHGVSREDDVDLANFNQNFNVYQMK